jgi:type II secretory pathway pseudopilin PulG
MDSSEQQRAQPKVKLNRSIAWIMGVVAIAMLCVFCAIGILIFAVGQIRISAEQQSAKNRLLQISLAMQNYHDVNGFFPHDTYDEDGKPLLSWRVQLAPYLEANDVFSAINHDEPWDSEHNKQLWSMIPKPFKSPFDGSRMNVSNTYYQFVIAPNSFGNRLAKQKLGNPMDDPDAVRFSSDNIRDSSKTLTVIESGIPVNWMKPDDLKWNLGEPVPPLHGNRRQKHILAVYADGSIQQLPLTMSATEFQQAITAQFK